MTAAQDAVAALEALQAEVMELYAYGSGTSIDRLREVGMPQKMVENIVGFVFDLIDALNDIANGEGEG